VVDRERKLAQGDRVVALAKECCSEEPLSENAE